LALPDMRHLPPADRLSQIAAVNLFVQRAEEVIAEALGTAETGSL
jgi:hypothetical protein